MHIEEKFAIGLGVLSVVLLALGWLAAKALSGAPNSVVRNAVPVISLATLATFAVFVAIARIVSQNHHG